MLWRSRRIASLEHVPARLSRWSKTITRSVSDKDARAEIYSKKRASEQNERATSKHSSGDVDLKRNKKLRHDAKLNLRRHRRDEIVPEMQTWHRLFLQYKTANDWASAISLLDQIRSQELEPDATTLSMVIAICAESRRLPEAMEVWESLKTRYKRPDNAAWGAILKACVKSQAMDKALEILGEWEATNNKPSNILYNIVILGFEKDHQKAIEVYNRMLAREILPSSHTFGTLLKSLKGTDKWEMAVKLLEDMRESRNGNNPNLVCYCSAMTVCNYAGRPDKAIEIFSDMRRSRVKLDAVAYTVVINCYLKNGDLDRALYMYNDAREKHIFLGVRMEEHMKLVSEMAKDENK